MGPKLVIPNTRKYKYELMRCVLCLNVLAQFAYKLFVPGTEMSRKRRECMRKLWDKVSWEWAPRGREN